MSPHLHSSASTATLKGHLYSHSLDQARRLSLTTAPYPALANGQPNIAAVGCGLVQHSGSTSGIGRQSGGASTSPPPPQPGQMDWNELVRKFTKHNPGRQLTAQAALLDHLLHSLLAKSSRSFATPPPSVSSLLAAPPSFTLPPLAPLIAPNDVPEALTSLDALSALLSSSRGGSDCEVNSARILLAVGRYAVGQPDAALRELKGCDLGMPERDGWEGYDLVLRVVGACVEAVSLSRLSTPTAELLPTYIRAAHLYSDALDLLPRSRDGVDARNDIELHRWGGEVLFRACLVAREQGSPETLPLHLLYLRRSSSFLSLFPSNSPRPALAFPASHRSTLHRSLRLLPSPSLSPSDAALNDRAQEKLVREFTKVPKAGEVNQGYLRFLEEVVQGWTRRGAGKEEGGRVVEILYAALTHTLQSHTLLRLLIHSLTLLGRFSEAAKALRLYRAYGDKARETGAAKNLGEMGRLKEMAEMGELWGQKDKEVEKGEVTEEEKEKREELREGQGEPSPEQQERESDIDSDKRFVETLVFGVRVLVKELGEGKEALEMAERAREVLDETEERSSKGSAEDGRVEWALGVAKGAVAHKETDSTRRTFLLSSCLSHLERASTLCPTSFSTVYSLAYALLTQRRVTPATSAAKKAVQLAPTGVTTEARTTQLQAWHLLALCVSAGKDMKGALEVLETALDESPSPSSSSSLPPPTSITPPTVDEQHDRWTAPASPIDLLAAQVELRLTKAAVVEYLEGAAAGLVEQQDLLAFFSSAVASLEPDPTPVIKEENGTGANGNTAPSMQGLGTDGKPPKTHRAINILGRRRSSSKKQHHHLGLHRHHNPADSPSATSSIAGAGAGDTLRVPTPSIAGSASPAAGSVANLSLYTPTPSISPSASSRSPSFSYDTSSSLSSSPPSLPTRAALLLSEVWLASAASFRRAGRIGEARGAVAEAEGVLEGIRAEGLEQKLREAVADGRAAVWAQLALLHVASSNPTAALSSIRKALALSPYHLPSRILLSRLYLAPPVPSPSPFSSLSDPTVSAQVLPTPPMRSHFTSPIPSSSSTTAPPPLAPSEAWKSLQLPLAESTLVALTSTSGGVPGTTSAEAWYELSRCYNLTGRKERERECLIKALELEETRSVREVMVAVERVL
ncbi:hypothetical protein JCM11641_008208 [Rhodosporidiobolus odoratus]